MRVTSFLAGLFSGAVVGGVAALLLAPESGADLRLHTREGAEQIWDGARSAADEKRAQLEAQLKSLKSPRSNTPEAA